MAAVDQDCVPEVGPCQRSVQVARASPGWADRTEATTAEPSDDMTMATARMVLRTANMVLPCEGRIELVLPLILPS